MTSAELVTLALAACGGDKEVLAERLGAWRTLHGIKPRTTMSRVRAIDRWREEGGPNPDFHSTLALLEIAGMLRAAADDEQGATSLDVGELVQVLSVVSEFLERLVRTSGAPAPPRPASENGA